MVAVVVDAVVAVEVNMDVSTNERSLFFLSVSLLSWILSSKNSNSSTDCFDSDFNHCVEVQEDVRCVEHHLGCLRLDRNTLKYDVGIDYSAIVCNSTTLLCLLSCLKHNLVFQ